MATSMSRIMCLLTLFMCCYCKNMYYPDLNYRAYPNRNRLVLKRIAEIIEVMSWREVVIVFDDHGSHFLLDFITSVETKYMKVTCFDVNDWKGNYSNLLFTIHQQYFPNIYILIYGGEDALRLLNTANFIDEEFSRITDYRHKSKWLVVPSDNSCVTSILNPADCVLENIIVISTWESKFGVFTFALSSRKFVFVQTYRQTSLYPNTVYGFNRRHFIISSHISPKFFEKQFTNGNITYSGYAKTFSDSMATFLNFTYSFVEPDDNQWGNMVNGTWDGLVGQLLRRQVDMAVAELTMTVAREQVSDFLLPPFFTQGLGMVFRKEDVSSKGWLTILQPFQLLVYYTIVAVAVCFCSILYTIERVNPMNKSDPVTKTFSSECFNISHMFISVVGCFCSGGDGIRPRTWTGRILSSSLWLCCIVIAATYSGNLTATLSVRREKKPFNSLEELVKLQEWKWGVHPATLTATILKESKRPDMRKAWSKILEFNTTDPTVLSTNSAVHIEHVLRGKYAYISLDPLIFQLSRNDCLLDTVTNVLTTQHVALAVPTNSPIKPEIERFIFYLFDGGVLKRWEASRYKDKRPKECLQTESSTKEMCLDDIKGVFAALAIGVVIAFVILFFENIFRRLFAKVDHKQ